MDVVHAEEFNYKGINMSFGKNIMHNVASTLNGVIAKDHRGMEYMVITASSFHNGNIANSIGEVNADFKPWAKKLLKSLPKEAA